MIPVQQRAVDPFSSYHSDNVNRISRIITSGEDRIIRTTDLLPTYASSNSIKISDGVAVKDDVTLHIKNNSGIGFSVIECDNSENYIPSSTSPTSNIFEFNGYYPSDTINSRAYIVLKYKYLKQSTPPEVELMILKDPNDFDEDLYMFLGMVYFSAPQTIVDPILLVDSVPSTPIQRKVANLQDAYTDVQARNADATNRITNHLPANNVAGYDRNKLVVTGSSFDNPPGKIKLVDFGYVASRVTNEYRTWTGSPIVVNHSLNLYPQVFVLDPSTGEFVQAIIEQITTTQFTVDFDFEDTNPGYAGPYNVWILY